MMMVSPLHREFGRFSFVLEETSVSGRYRVKIFPRFRTLPTPYARVHDSSKSRHRYPATNKSLLAVHAAVGNIL